MKMICYSQADEERALTGLALSAHMIEVLVAGVYYTLNAYFVFNSLRAYFSTPREHNEFLVSSVKIGKTESDNDPR
jgi:hypothetical protein